VQASEFVAIMKPLRDAVLGSPRSAPDVFSIFFDIYKNYLKSGGKFPETRVLRMQPESVEGQPVVLDMQTRCRYTIESSAAAAGPHVHYSIYVSRPAADGHYGSGRALQEFYGLSLDPDFACVMLQVWAEILRAAGRERPVAAAPLASIEVEMIDTHGRHLSSATPGFPRPLYPRIVKVWYEGLGGVAHRVSFDTRDQLNAFVRVTGLVLSEPGEAPQTQRAARPREGDTRGPNMVHELTFPNTETIRDTMARANAVGNDVYFLTNESQLATQESLERTSIAAFNMLVNMLLNLEATERSGLQIGSLRFTTNDVGMVIVIIPDESQDWPKDRRFCSHNGRIYSWKWGQWIDLSISGNKQFFDTHIAENQRAIIEACAPALPRGDDPPVAAFPVAPPAAAAAAPVVPPVPLSVPVDLPPAARPSAPSPLSAVGAVTESPPVTGSALPTPALRGSLPPVVVAGGTPPPKASQTPWFVPSAEGGSSLIPSSALGDASSADPVAPGAIRGASPPVAPPSVPAPASSATVASAGSTMADVLPLPPSWPPAHSSSDSLSPGLGGRAVSGSDNPPQAAVADLLGARGDLHSSGIHPNRGAIVSHASSHSKSKSPPSPLETRPSSQGKPKPQGFFAWLRDQWERFVHWVRGLFTSKPQTPTAGEGSTHPHRSSHGKGHGKGKSDRADLSPRPHHGHLHGANKSKSVHQQISNPTPGAAVDSRADRGPSPRPSNGG
jgi:hypothetical protein